MNKIIEKDILTVEEGVIVQSTNCCGPMGGLAGAIKRKWPIVEEKYLELLASKPKKHNFTFLGNAQLIEIELDKLFVCNIFGQLDISRETRQTEYSATQTGLENLQEILNDLVNKESFLIEPDVYFPWNFGCGLGGGDWNIVSEIIYYYFPYAKISKLT